MKISLKYERQTNIINFNRYSKQNQKGMVINMDEPNHGYFEEALSNFTKDFAYGGAIRHLVDHGYTVDQIIKEFHYPISRESIEKIVDSYKEQKK